MISKPQTILFNFAVFSTPTRMGWPIKVQLHILQTARFVDLLYSMRMMTLLLLPAKVKQLNFFLPSKWDQQVSLFPDPCTR